MKKIVFDKVNARVVTEDDTTNVFYTNELTCPDSVIEHVVNLNNNNNNNTHRLNTLLGSNGEIDNYLLNCSECTQEDREIIVEALYVFYYGKS